MTTALKVHVLCNPKDERNEEERKLHRQFETLGLPLPKKEGEEGEQLSEWREGYIILEKIELFYPFGPDPNHTVVHMESANAITIQESQEELLKILNETNTPPTNFTEHGQRIYQYPATIS